MKDTQMQALRAIFPPAEGYKIHRVAGTNIYEVRWYCRYDTAELKAQIKAMVARAQQAAPFPTWEFAPRDTNLGERRGSGKDIVEQLNHSGRWHFGFVRLEYKGIPAVVEAVA